MSRWQSKRAEDPLSTTGAHENPELYCIFPLKGEETAKKGVLSRRGDQRKSKSGIFLLLEGTFYLQRATARLCQQPKEQKTTPGCVHTRSGLDARPVRALERRGDTQRRG